MVIVALVIGTIITYLSLSNSPEEKQKQYIEKSKDKSGYNECMKKYPNAVFTEECLELLENYATN